VRKSTVEESPKVKMFDKFIEDLNYWKLTKNKFTT